MANRLIFVLFFLSINIYAQKDSLQVGDSYWEDQLYINVSYNILDNQPEEVSKSGFSFGFSGGYIKDIPFVKSGKIAFGIGLGYGFDSYNHRLKVVEGEPANFQIDNGITNNKLVLHNIEIPVQFRWRSSTVNTYSFWRFYTGIKLSYNISNNFTYDEAGVKIDISNFTEYNKFQTGLILSAGYGTFNFHMYYGLTPIFKNASLNGNKIDTNIIRFGLSFYLL
ncbi:PorT family protein [Tenacibaculum sp. AHE15PA]|uniref:porin family protein n=1 Tax=unclassified Tenacibaculum TaxID=2635139 RepID=UPI001C4EE86E|nr:MULTISPECIES: porin family protein [unclassified Tenacibaculum]QXP72815.1 PorT family protein [Tenacibaculum sp. AHE14PA]QXP76729.1 PorT family protein [Tenacibaculum sp. AHE15PA]